MWFATENGLNRYDGYSIKVYKHNQRDSTSLATNNVWNIVGTLDSKPNQSYRIEFFSSPQADSTQFGEGKTFLGSGIVVTNASCTGTINVTLPVTVPSGYYISATATDTANNTSEFSRSIAVGTTDVHQMTDEIPKEFALEQNYPNPFNPTTAIKFQVPMSKFVTLKVYDVLGREVRTLVNENLQVGSYETMFDATGLASGMYLYRLQAGSFVEMKKLILLR